MRRGQKRALWQWLSAERAGSDGDAERALFKLFQAMPLPRPGRDFVARTLVRAGAEPELDAPSPAVFRWVFRVGVVASVFLAGASAVLSFGMVMAFVRSGGDKQLLGWSISLLATASEQVARGLVVGDGLLRVGEALAAAAAGPGVLIPIGLTLVVTVVAFRFLNQLLIVERSSSHV